MKILTCCLFLVLPCQVWGDNKYAETNKVNFEETKINAEQGDVDAQDNLVLMYDMGLGVPADTSISFEWFTKAAKQGNAGAQYCLGKIYIDGKGVSKNNNPILGYESQVSFSMEGRFCRGDLMEKFVDSRKGFLLLNC